MIVERVASQICSRDPELAPEMSACINQVRHFIPTEIKCLDRIVSYNNTGKPMCRIGTWLKKKQKLGPIA
jgi:hypothetical protein